jgi:hypothetical protein
LSQNLNINLKLLTLDFQLPGCQSLNEKRQRLGGLKDRFGKIPNLEVTGSAHHDNHQLSQWTFVAIGNNLYSSDLKILNSDLLSGFNSRRICAERAVPFKVMER